jgi:hypothetical protein
MKKLILTAALFVSALTPAYAREYRCADPNYNSGWITDGTLSQMDRNNDGIITMNEHEAYNARLFRKADRNGDHVLSRREITAFNDGVQEGFFDRFNRDGYGYNR